MKHNLAVELSEYKFRERLKIYRAARLLRKFDKLTDEDLSKEEELANAVAELEETDE